MHHKLLFLLLFLVTSCNKNFLRVQVDNISKDFLASYHVGTPDPRLISPPVGQRMTITWYFPNQFFSQNEIFINVFLHFGDHTVQKFCFKPTKNSGFYLYSLMNQDYYHKKGLLTYKVEAYGNGLLIKEWRHQLWVELIDLDLK